MAQILIGYIPITKLPGLTNKAARRRALANLFHACMWEVLHSIAEPGETGVAMMSGDGMWRRCHPILANFVGDYPEQALVTCTHQQNVISLKQLNCLILPYFPLFFHFFQDCVLKFQK